jgi:hypothetical protein
MHQEFAAKQTVPGREHGMNKDGFEPPVEVKIFANKQTKEFVLPTCAGLAILLLMLGRYVISSYLSGGSLINNPHLTIMLFKYDVFFLPLMYFGAHAFILNSTLLSRIHFPVIWQHTALWFLPTFFSLSYTGQKLGLFPNDVNAMCLAINTLKSLLLIDYLFVWFNATILAITSQLIMFLVIATLQEQRLSIDVTCNNLSVKKQSNQNISSVLIVFSSAGLIYPRLSVRFGSSVDSFFFYCAISVAIILFWLAMSCLFRRRLPKLIDVKTCFSGTLFAYGVVSLLYVDIQGAITSSHVMFALAFSLLFFF